MDDDQASTPEDFIDFAGDKSNFINVYGMLLSVAIM